MNVTQLHNDEKMARLREQVRDLQRDGGPPYSGGGGGDMLEARVKHLEDDMKEIKGDLKSLRSDVAELKGKVGMLPGWGGMMAMAAFIITAIGLMLRFIPPVSPT